MSFRFILSRELPKNFLRFLHIVQREFSGVDQVRHNGLSPASERVQEFINQTLLGESREMVASKI